MTAHSDESFLSPIPGVQPSGVYILVGKNGYPLYVGRSKNFYHRLLYHSSTKRFDFDFALVFPMDAREAVFEEARLIREISPEANRVGGGGKTRQAKSQERYMQNRLCRCGRTPEPTKLVCERCLERARRRYRLKTGRPADCPKSVQGKPIITA